MPKSDNIKAFTTPYGEFRLRRPTIGDHIQGRIEAVDLAKGKNDAVLDILTTTIASITVAARREKQKSDDTPAGFPPDFEWADAYDFDWVSDLHKEWSDWWQGFRNEGKSAEPATASPAGGPD